MSYAWTSNDLSEKGSLFREKLSGEVTSREQVAMEHTCHAVLPRLNPPPALLIPSYRQHQESRWESS